MRYWNTGDAVTDSNLAYIENYTRPWPGITADHFHDKIVGLIRVHEMLPAAVRRHFKWPSLFYGNQHYKWTPGRLEQEDREISQILLSGLDNCAADEQLETGCADLSDRPVSQGEKILSALEAFRQRRGTAEQSNLYSSLHCTPFAYLYHRLEKVLQRKRPSGSQSLESMVLDVLRDIRWEAENFHRERAK